MRIRGAWRVRRAAERIANRLSHRAVILLYHRIAEAANDPWQLSVTPRHFAEHVEVIRRAGYVMSLQKLVKCLDEGSLPRRAVVVTFDDGYADNLINAKPALEKHDAPATVFVTSGYVGAAREFWWDELDKLFLQPGRLPAKLSLSMNESAYEWDLGDAAHYSEARFQQHRRWRAWENGDSNPRHLIYHSLWRLMRPLPDSERQRLRDELISWSGGDAKARPTHRALTRDELVVLARGGLVEIGCHTVTHPPLSALPPESQEQEIRQSKASLEEVLGHSITSFAYPYGGPCDYTERTTSLVRDAGFSCACSTAAIAVTRRADPFQLPRVQVADCDGDDFAAKLKAWLGD
ncbi:MAG: polysaccharide deacetylase family protein [Blastocatellia bacterium]